MIKRNFRFKSKSVMVPLYKSIVRPHLDYCVQAWRPHYRKDIDKLEKMQRRAMKMVKGLEGHSYSDRLRILGFTTLETRFFRVNLIEVFKILSGFENVDPKKFFQVVRDDELLHTNLCLREGTGWMLGGSSLRIGCARSGTGWMMMWLGGAVNT